jgi:hypothetical protein
MHFIEMASNIQKSLNNGSIATVKIKIVPDKIEVAIR